MPQIPTYNNELTTIPTSNEAISARESAAHRVAILGREEGEAIGGGIAAVGKSVEQIGAEQDQLEGQKEISKGIADLALMQAGHTTLWTQALKTTDPNHIDTAAGMAFQDLNEKGEAFLSRFQTKAGKAWAQRSLGEYQAHFIAQARADSAIAAGHAAVSNYYAAANAQVKMVQDNPALLDFALGQANSNHEALVSNTPGLNAGDKVKADTLRQKTRGELFQAGDHGQDDKELKAGQGPAQLP